VEGLEPYDRFLETGALAIIVPAFAGFRDKDATTYVVKVSI
jgi:hypothetical protein